MNKQINQLLISLSVAVISISAPINAANDTAAIVVLQPTAGQIFRVGDTMSVRWRVIPTLTQGGVLVKISPNNGRNYYTISNVGSIYNTNTTYYTRGDTAIYKWVVLAEIIRPDDSHVPFISDSCLMRVEAPYDMGVPYGLSGKISVKSNVGVIMTGNKQKDPVVIDGIFSGMVPGIGLKVTVNLIGDYSLIISDLAGRTVFAGQGSGRSDYLVPQQRLTSGMKIIRVSSDKKTVSDRVLILE